MAGDGRPQAVRDPGPVRLQELAGQFHGYYNRNRVLSDDRDLATARLYLLSCIRTTIRNALTLLGVSAPERM